MLLRLDQFLVVFYVHFLFFLLDVSSVLYNVVNILIYVKIHFRVTLFNTFNKIVNLITDVGQVVWLQHAVLQGVSDCLKLGEVFSVNGRLLFLLSFLLLAGIVALQIIYFDVKVCYTSIYPRKGFVCGPVVVLVLVTQPSFRDSKPRHLCFDELPRIGESDVIFFQHWVVLPNAHLTSLLLKPL